MRTTTLFALLACHLCASTLARYSVPRTQVPLYGVECMPALLPSNSCRVYTGFGGGDGSVAGAMGPGVGATPGAGVTAAGGNGGGDGLGGIGGGIIRPMYRSPIAVNAELSDD